MTSKNNMTLINNNSSLDINIYIEHFFRELNFKIDKFTINQYIITGYDNKNNPSYLLLSFGNKYVTLKSILDNEKQPMKLYKVFHNTKNNLKKPNIIAQIVRVMINNGFDHKTLMNYNNKSNISNGIFAFELFKNNLLKNLTSINKVFTNFFHKNEITITLINNNSTMDVNLDIKKLLDKNYSIEEYITNIITKNNYINLNDNYLIDYFYSDFIVYIHKYRELMLKNNIKFN